MSPRRRAILIVSLILLLIAVIIAIIFFLTRSLAKPEEPPAEPFVPAETVNEPSVKETFENPLITEEPEVQGSTAAQQMAELFAERFGSYSNQGDYQNLRDLLPVMTARYRSSTEAFLATAESAPGQPYEGVTSVKISTDVRSVDEDSAVIAVTLQQSRSVGVAPATTGYRTLRMELEIVGTDWRVDEASWEN